MASIKIDVPGADFELILGEGAKWKDSTAGRIAIDILDATVRNDAALVWHTQSVVDGENFCAHIVRQQPDEIVAVVTVREQ